MEEGKKKMIMIGIIVACIVAAIIITVATHSGGTEGGIDTLRHGEAMFWMKCRNPKCESTWQMDMKDYFDYIEKHRVGMTVPGVVCTKCGEDKGYRAEKCEKCGFIFERGAVANDLPDRCPKCNYSASEELRKKARGEVPQTTEKQ